MSLITSAIPAAQSKATMSQKSTVERAFELARNGECHSMEAIRKALVVEGYVAIQGHLASPSLVKQLKAAMKTANVA